jgi:hypothetical protein
LRCQPEFSDISPELTRLFSRLENNFDDNSRITINDSIICLIDNYVESDSIFEHRFINIRYLGQIISSDKNLKIITWNLILKDSPNRYFCYFIRKTDHGRKKLIYSLKGENSDKPIRTDTVYSEGNWYGALYYDLRPVKVKKEVHYVLLGMDFGNRSVNRKIIDVLSFTKDGDIIFGKKWFSVNNDTKFREVLEYDAGGVMSLKFYSAKSIVFDHLVPLSSKIKEEKVSYGAEYSFDSYNYKDGLWRLKKNVDVRNKD